MRVVPWLAMLLGCPSSSTPGRTLEDLRAVALEVDTGTVPLLDVELIEVDTGSYEGLDLEMRTYVHPDGPETPDGSLPTFLLLRPTEPPEAPMPLLMWMHGGVAGLDGDPEYGHLCSFEGVKDMAYGSLQTRHLAYRLVEEQAAMVVPVSPWCDLWSGLHGRDPVDTRHASLAHVRQVLASLEHGVEGLRTDPDQTSLWGVSLGASGALVVAADMQRRGRPPLAVVSDSGPWDLTTLYTIEDGTMPTEWLDHILGGPPFEEDGTDSPWAENYDRVDPVRLVEQELAVPVFLHHNRYDLIVDEFHGPNMTEALEAHYPDRDAHFAVWNPAHRSPGSYHHTQSNNRVPPMISALDASWRFLRGFDVAFFEAEELSELEATVYTGEHEEHGSVLQQFSLEAAVGRTADEGPGLLLRAALPTDLPTRMDRFILQWVTVGFDGVPDDELVAELRLLDPDGETLYRHEVLGRQTRAELSHYYTEDHVEGATVRFDDGVSPHARTLEVELLHESGGTVFLDGFWAVFSP